MSYRLIPQAQEDFERIYIYLHSESPAAADRLAEALIRSYKFLAQWPNAGHLRADIPHSSFRFWTVSTHYIVLYAPDTNPLSNRRHPAWRTRYISNFKRALHHEMNL